MRRFLQCVSIFVWCLAFQSCSHSISHSHDFVIDTNTDPQAVASSGDTDNKSSEVVESFADESQIGIRGKNKIEMVSYKGANMNLVVIKFFSRKGENWELKQSFEFEKDNLLDCDPRLDDFNNDELKDFTYVSTVAVRGANEVRKLFIYDKELDELVYIRNSEQYPNLNYNKKLRCIDAWLFHGATTTVFLKLDGDILKQFASVDTGLERIVTLTDAHGKETVVRRDKMQEEDVYVRYKSFNPPVPYESSHIGLD